MFNLLYKAGKHTLSFRDKNQVLPGVNSFFIYFFCRRQEKDVPCTLFGEIYSTVRYQNSFWRNRIELEQLKA